MIIVGIGTELKSMTYDNTNFKVIGSYAPNNMANGYLTQKSLIKIISFQQHIQLYSTKN